MEYRRQQRSELRRNVFYRSLKGWLLNGGKHVSRRHGGAGFGGEAGYVPGAGGLHFVLHFHGFDDHDSLARFHRIADRNKHANHLPGIGAATRCTPLRAPAADCRL